MTSIQSPNIPIISTLHLFKYLKVNNFGVSLVGKYSWRTEVIQCKTAIKINKLNVYILTPHLRTMIYVCFRVSVAFESFFWR